MSLPLWCLSFVPQPRGGNKPFQTFSLDASAQTLIDKALLDRFLACMKPASITQPQLRLGFFSALVLLGFDGLFQIFNCLILHPNQRFRESVNFSHAPHTKTAPARVREGQKFL